MSELDLNEVVNDMLTTPGDFESRLFSLNANEVALLDGFIDIDDRELMAYLDQAISDIRRLDVVKEYKRPPKKIQAELDAARKAITNLSPLARMHLQKELYAMDPDGGLSFPRMRDALAVPYDKNVFGTHPAREALVMHAKYIDQNFIRADLEAKDTRDTLMQLIEFMSAACGVRASVDKLIEDVRKRT